MPVSFTLAPEKWLRHEHLAYEQLAPYVENSLEGAERELADLHLKLCGQCREDIRSFQDYRLQSEMESANIYVNNRQPAWRDSLQAQWSRLVAGWKPAYAAAILLMVVSAVIFAAFLLERNRAGEQQAQQPQLGQPNQAITSPSTNSPGVPTVTNSNGAVALAPAANENANSPNKVEDSPRPNRTRSLNPEQKVIQQPLRSSVTEALALNDGRERIVIDNSGNLTGLTNLPQETQQSIKEVLLAQNIERPSVLVDLAGQAGGLRGTGGGSPSFKLLSPAGTVIASDRPTFNWTPVTGATSYRVQVVDSRNREVANSGELPSNVTEWTLSKALLRDNIYTWVVTAVVDGREVIAPSALEPEMRFKVLDEETSRKINLLQQRSRSHLALGILYARAGMLAEAEQEFQMLVKQNPNSPVAQKLLRSVQSWR